MTEWNLKSRETVGTNETIQYMCGPSYVHSERDFEVGVLTDGAGQIASSSTLQIAEGWGIVDGVFIQSLVPVTVDLLEINAQAQLEGLPPLKGRLSVGLRAMYATESTVAGTLRTYDSNEIYEGIQLVILPQDEFKLPIDVPTQQDQVTAHLKLADFNFVNGSVSSIVQNYPAKVQNVSAERVGNIEKLLSDIYVTKTGLDPRKLYTFAGKGTDDTTRMDTWCDSTGSLMVWDANPQAVDGATSSYKEATFAAQTDGRTVLIMPHQNVDGMTNTAGTYQHYADKKLELPLANYSQGTPGTVDRNYTNHIKEVQEQINNIYRMPAGKQVGFIDILNDRSELPTLNNNWKVGDYILVRQDNTMSENYTGTQPPSTMYVVLPGIISAYTYASKVDNSDQVPSDLTGIEIQRDTWDNTEGDLVVDTADPDNYGQYFDLSAGFRGQLNVDYFMIHVITGEDTYTRYYFKVSATGNREYSSPVQVTAEFPLAQEEIIGGFYNVPETALDNGYVFRDETGHLILLDYALLRSGVLAYQLGEDFETAQGTTAEEIQANLDEYVNSRVAFPNANQIANADNPNVINITIDLSAEAAQDNPEINIYNIDSRFNTSVYIHINGSADENTVINISDCQKVRIDSNIGGTPVINLYRSCLYYDANVIDYLSTISNMTLWYERYEDDQPNLLVDSMTVTEVDAPVIPDDLDYWNPSAPNDNHYMYALHSITFGPDGTIVGAGMFVKNESTSNVQEGKSIITSTFRLPQGAGLQYPKSRLTKQIKITGSFVNAYATTSPQGYMVMNTSFSALTDATSAYDSNDYTEGVISFLTDAELIQSVTGLPLGTQLDCWQTGSFHCFKGVVI
nr:MAG TPA: hypothetical protein [Caudoviricetes sp.]